MRVSNPRHELCKVEGKVWNCGFSDNGSLDNLSSRNNDVWGGDTVISTDEKVRDTVNTYGHCNSGKDLQNGEGVVQCIFHWSPWCA